jgi:hypothetical protein
MQPIGYAEEKAYCPFYAVDPEFGLVAVSALTTAQELGLRIAARLIAGQVVVLEDQTVLHRQRDLVVPLCTSDDQESDVEIRYKSAYTRNSPHPLETGVGYETCILHRDATMQAQPRHWAYIIRLPGQEGDQAFRARFLHQWGRVTELPAKPSWSEMLWGMGLKLGLVTPLKTFGCDAWRIDPRWERPDNRSGWKRVLKTIVQLQD